MTNIFQTKSARLIILISISLLFTQCNDIKDIMAKRFLMIEVEKINKDCPKQLSHEIRLDSCKVADRITLKTYATMIHVDADYYNADAFYKMTKPSLVYTIQTSEDFKQAKDYDVTFMYVYNDVKGKRITEITITPEDYNKPIDKNSMGVINSIEEDSIEITLKSLAENLKESIPMQIDKTTTLTNVELSENNILEYTYIVAIDKKDINKDFATNMKIAFDENAKHNSEIQKILKAKATLKYIYLDRNNTQLCEIILTEDSLK